MVDAILCCLKCDEAVVGHAIAPEGCLKCGNQYLSWRNFDAKKAQYVKSSPTGLAFGGPHIANSAAVKGSVSDDS
jgi:hypothetical protein